MVRSSETHDVCAPETQVPISRVLGMWPRGREIVPVWETVARGAIADFRCASKLSGRKALRDSDDPQPLYPSRSPDEPSNKGLD